MNQKLLAAEHPHVQGEFERLRYLLKVQGLALQLAAGARSPDTFIANAANELAEGGIVDDNVVVTVLLGKLEPKELGALIDALDRMKPEISEEAWNLAAAMDAEEARRVKADEPVAYSDEPTA